MNDAARTRRVRRRLKAGQRLPPEDQAAIAGAIEIAERSGVPLELALRWPARLRSQVRFLDALGSPELSGYAWAGAAALTPGR